MRYLFIFCLLFAGTVSAAPTRDQKVDPELAAKMKVMKIHGIDMTMTMGEAVALVKAEGHEPKCSNEVCSIRTSKPPHFVLSFGYGRGAPRSGVNFDQKIERINYSHNIQSHEECPEVQKAIALFCLSGNAEFPCQKSNNRMEVLVNPHIHSADGWIYNLRGLSDPPIQCKIGVNRKQIVK